MNIKTGCDLVPILKFQKSAERGGSAFLEKIFSAHELTNCHSPQSMAGLFAAKEAVKKALRLKADDWKKIEVTKEADGSPRVRLIEIDRSVVSSDISISHDGDYAMATATFLLK